jgi:hypothetical protein
MPSGRAGAVVGGRLVAYAALVVVGSLSAGCSHERHARALRDRIAPWQDQLRAAAPDAHGDKLAPALRTALQAELTTLVAATRTAGSRDDVERSQRQLERTRQTEATIRELWDQRATALQRLQELLLRYGKEPAGSKAAAYAKVLEAAKKGADEMEFADHERAGLVPLQARVEDELAAVQRALADAAATDLPHVKEALAALEARAAALLADVKAQQASANEAQKPLLADARRLLETLPTLRNGDGSAYAVPAIVQRATKQVDDAEQKRDAAIGEIELRPSPWFRMHTGLITLSPYVVREATVGDPADAQFVLDEASTKPSFYVEADFLHRWAWLRDDERTLPSAAGVLGDVQWLAPTDHEIRLRFQDADEIKDQSSAVGGDWAAEASVGWAMVEYEVPGGPLTARKRDPRGSLTLETNAGFATDRGSNDVHGFVQGGFGSAWSFPIEVQKNLFLPATFFGGVYYGIHSFPRVDADGGVRTDDARPYYNDLGALGVKIDVTYPLSEAVEFVIGGRLAGRFENEAVENWSLWAGVSLPIGRLFGSTVK